jgi:hypothetical protein
MKPGKNLGDSKGVGSGVGVGEEVTTDSAI